MLGFIKPMQCLWSSILATASILGMGAVCPCWADITFTFTETATGGVFVSAQGSGNVTGNGSSNDWDLNNFASDFLVDTHTVNLTDAPASGVLFNVTTSQFSFVNTFVVDRDDPDGDDIEFRTDDVVSFSTGDFFTLAFTAEFTTDGSNGSDVLLYNELIQGVHTDIGSGNLEEIFGTTTVIVPEPNFSYWSPLVLGAFAGALIWRRRRILSVKTKD